MPQNTHLEIISAESERLHETAHTIHDPQKLHDKAEALAHELIWLPNESFSHAFADRCSAAARALKPVFIALDRPIPRLPISDDFRWLYDNGRLLYMELQNVDTVLPRQKKIPHVRITGDRATPRVLAIAERFLEAVGYDFSEQEFVLFVEVFRKQPSCNCASYGR